MLHVAAGLGHALCLKLLLDAGLAPDGAPAAGGAAACDGATPLHAAAMGGSVECVEALLAKGRQRVRQCPALRIVPLGTLPVPGMTGTRPQATADVTQQLEHGRLPGAPAFVAAT